MATPTAFGRHGIQKAVDAMPSGESRRRFLQAGIAGALAAGLPLLSACGGGDGDSGDGGGGGGDNAVPLTLFFNYSHLDYQGKTMWIHCSRKNYRLRQVSEVPEVLARERLSNRFLAEVDDRYITHVVEGVPAPQDQFVAFHYGVSEGVDGAWTLNSVDILLPEAAATIAFQRLSDSVGASAGQGIPLSAKRRKYGVPAATSARDLFEETALHDTNSHAATLVAMHKDMLALDGNAASTVIHKHVTSEEVEDLSDLIGQLGGASPEISNGKINPTGWGTLRPMLDATGQPRRLNKPGDPADGRRVYLPLLHPETALLVGKAVSNVLPRVQNDAALGADVTAKPPGSSLRGALWVRRDGQPAVIANTAGIGAPGDEAISVLWPNGQNHWLECTATATPQDAGTQLLTVSYSNTGLRYLSCYIEFYDEAGNLLKLGEMPGFADKSWVTSPRDFLYDPVAFAQATRISIGTVSSLGTVMGIPVFTDAAYYGSLDFSLRLSEKVHRVRLYAGGLGNGSNNHSDTIAGGVAGTVFFNYLLTTMFGALGSIPNMDLAFGLGLSGGAALFNALGAHVTDAINGNFLDTQQFWEDQGMNLLNLLISLVGVHAADKESLVAFGNGVAALIGAATAEEAVEQAVPIIGLILCIESAVTSAVDLALTTTAIAQSPFTYITDLVFSHNLSVAIYHDPGNSTFPRAANLMRVIATFDDGKPYLADYLGTPEATQPLTVTFYDVPLGGGVDIDVSFYQTPPSGTVGSNILLGRGGTGRMSNDATALYAVTIVEKEYPVGPTTHYQHVQRSYLNASNAHIWIAEAAPSTPPSQFDCGSAGEICQFNDITVRQGNSEATTVLGYAWRGQNAAGGGDLGQLALMDADSPSAGYVTASNRLSVDGMNMAFSPTAGGSNNFYVDPSGAYPMIRGITLDGAGAPSLDGPASNRAYGRLSLKSDALLIHPAGYLISINTVKNRFEVLRPPAEAVTDAVADTQFIAQVLGGSGLLPGKLSDVAAATITKDGTLLMLENGNSRIQAFDFGGNPVRYFINALTPYFLPLTEMPASAGWRHLDIQAEIGGLLYVLSSNTQTGHYRLSIYDKASQLQQALSVTEGIFAARIGLDHWRDLYTLNYQPITVQGSGAQPAITEPSVSLWTPQG